MIIIQLDSDQLSSLIQNAVNKAIGETPTLPPQPEPETLLTVREAAKFLSLSVPTIYGLISKGELPVIKRSKRCYFSNIELLEYMKAGRRKIVSEIESETDKYLSSRKKKEVKNG